MVNKGLETESRICNPYEQYGVLNVNTAVPTENLWEPIAAPEDCQPVNFVELLRRAQSEGDESVPELEFLRNRTIVIFGDSVDRDHNEHFCSFVGGWYEMIGDTHELSPPHLPAASFHQKATRTYFTGTPEWPDYHQSHPFICHVEKPGLRILKVFHYGFQKRGTSSSVTRISTRQLWLKTALTTSLVPLIQAISTQYTTSPVPDILSIAPRFWGLFSFPS